MQLLQSGIENKSTNKSNKNTLLKMYAHLDPNTALQIPKKVQYLRVTDAAWCCRLGLFVVSLVGGV